MAQFRVEFVLDESSGRYLAEIYDPDNQQEMIARTEALYPTQAAAVLGLVQLFKEAILQFPRPGTPPKRVIRSRKAKRKGKKRAAARKAAPRKAAAKKAKRRTSSRRKKA